MGMTDLIKNLSYAGMRASGVFEDAVYQVSSEQTYNIATNTISDADTDHDIKMTFGPFNQDDKRYIFNDNILDSDMKGLLSTKGLTFIPTMDDHVVRTKTNETFQIKDIKGLWESFYILLLRRV